MLVGARESELYPRAAVHLPITRSFAARRLDRAALVDAHEIRIARARRAAIGLPEEVLERAFLKLEDLKRTENVSLSK
jgi:hypothetical protein